MEVPEIVKVFEGFSVGDWVWCLHCERVYKVGEFRERDSLQYCPYPDCSGDAVIDAIHWEEIARQFDYPVKNPARGHLYPMLVEHEP